MDTNGNILITFKMSSDNLVDIYTVTRDVTNNPRKSWKNHFILFLDKLKKSLHPTEDENGKSVWQAVCERDRSNYMEYYFNPCTNDIIFRAAWLCDDGNGNLRGKLQNFSVPADKIYNFVTFAKKGEGFTHLHLDADRYPHVCFSESAYRKLSKLSPQERRAMSKFLRDNLKYPRADKIEVYNDFGEFGFVEHYRGADNRYGIVGGIIPHDSTREGKDHVIRKYMAYHIHT